MRLASYLILRSCRNGFFNSRRTCSRSKYYSDSILGSSLKVFMPSLVQSFVIHHSLFKRNNELSFMDESTKVKGSSNANKKKPPSDPKVSVIFNNQELVMEVSDAQKFAKRKNMNLVPIESARKDKKKYKLVNELHGNKKHESIDKKKLVIRSEISPHDLEVKINQMFKLVNKGFEVVCMVESQSGKAKLGGVLDGLENSKMKKYFHRKVQTTKGFSLFYTPIAGIEEKKTTGSSAEPSE